MNIRALIATLVAGLASVTSHGQEGVYKAGNRTVAVYATVTGPDGRLVPDLTRDAFAIDDNGKRQEITLFANAIQPITAVVLLDRSGSMRANFRLVEQAAAQFVEALQPERQGAHRQLLEPDPARSARLHIGSRRAAHHPPLGAAARGPDAVVERDLRRDHRAAAPAGTPGDSRVHRRHRQSARRRVRQFIEGRDEARRRRGRHGLRHRACPASGRHGRWAERTVAARRAFRRTRPLRRAAGAVRQSARSTGCRRSRPRPAAGTSSSRRRTIWPRPSPVSPTSCITSTSLGFTPTSLDGKMHSLEVQVDGAGMKARARKSYLARAVR